MKLLTAYKLMILGYTAGPAVEDACPICEHKWGPHILFTPGGVTDGGRVTCPEVGCHCSGNWLGATLLEDLA